MNELPSQEILRQLQAGSREARIIAQRQAEQDQRQQIHNYLQQIGELILEAAKYDRQPVRFGIKEEYLASCLRDKINAQPEYFAVIDQKDWARSEPASDLVYLDIYWLFEAQRVRARSERIAYCERHRKDFDYD
jgi:hypothetical protein